MDGLGWFLFLVIIACVIGLIAAVSHSNRDDDEDVAEDEPAVSWSAPKPPAPGISRETERPVRLSGPEQITMYAYDPPRRLQRCRVCDGENEVNAGFCRVCGMRLK